MLVFQNMLDDWNADVHINSTDDLSASQAAHSRQPCVNSHQLSQWEPVIFDHPQNQRPLTDR